MEDIQAPDRHVYINTQNLKWRSQLVIMHIITKFKRQRVFLPPHLPLKFFLVSSLWFLVSRLSLSVEEPGGRWRALHLNQKYRHCKMSNRRLIDMWWMHVKSNDSVSWAAAIPIGTGERCNAFVPSPLPYCQLNCAGLCCVFPEEETRQQFPQRQSSASNLNSLFFLVLLLIRQSRACFLSLWENGQWREEKSCL